MKVSFAKALGLIVPDKLFAPHGLGPGCVKTLDLHFRTDFFGVASLFVVGTTRFAEPASSLRNDLLKNGAVKMFSYSLGHERTCGRARSNV